MNPQRSTLSPANFSFGPDTPVLFRTAFDHYRIGTAAGLMSVDQHGDEIALQKDDANPVLHWAAIPSATDPHWRQDDKPYDVPILVAYSLPNGTLRHVVEHRNYKHRIKTLMPARTEIACIGWMNAGKAFDLHNDRMRRPLQDQKIQKFMTSLMMPRHSVIPGNK